MRIYAILGNVRIAYIFFQFFAYGQTQKKCDRNPTKSRIRRFGQSLGPFA